MFNAEIFGYKIIPLPLLYNDDLFDEIGNMDR